MGKVKGPDGQARKERGMDRAATNPDREPYLEIMRLAALQAPDRYTGITIEDAYDVLTSAGSWGIWTWEEMNAYLGPAAGSVFIKGDGWVATGKRRYARLNPLNHAREHKVWRLRRPVRAQPIRTKGKS